MSDPKADCEALLNMVMPFAQQMLTTHGEFLPFGSAMRANGQLVSVAGYDGEEPPQSADVIARIKEGFIAAARKGEYEATAVAYDIKVRLPTTNEKSDAITVLLDHRDNYSVIVMFPYTIAGGELTLGDAFAQRGDADIFPPRSGRRMRCPYQDAV